MASLVVPEIPDPVEEVPDDPDPEVDSDADVEVDCDADPEVDSDAEAIVAVSMADTEAMVTASRNGVRNFIFSYGLGVKSARLTGESELRNELLAERNLTLAWSMDRKTLQQVMVKNRRRLRWTKTARTSRLRVCEMAAEFSELALYCPTFVTLHEGYVLLRSWIMKST